MDFKKTLSEYAKGFQLEDTPEEVVSRSKLILLDSITSIISGNQLDHMNKLQKEVSLQSKESARTHSVYGTKFTTTSQMAALVNGIAMVSNEMDEGNPLAKGHPSCHFLPAILALAEQEEVSGSKFLESFIVGYEIGARAGSAINLREEIHPHGNWGIIGSSFAVGKLLDYSEGEYVASLDISASFSEVSLWQSVLEGHRIRDLHIGMNNLNACLIPSFLRSGFSSSPSTIESIYGSGILGESFEPSKLIRGLSYEYYLKKTYFKFYSFCRFCHSPIDALEKLLSNEKIKANKVEKIDVFTYSLAAKLSKQEVENEYAGKFSIPAALTYSFYKREGTKHTKDFAKRIFVYEDKNLTQLLPEERNARIELTTVDGKTYSSYARGATGDATDEHLEVKVIDKCREILSGIIGLVKTEELIEEVLNIEVSRDIGYISKITMQK